MAHLRRGETYLIFQQGVALRELGAFGVMDDDAGPIEQIARSCAR